MIKKLFIWPGLVVILALFSYCTPRQGETADGRLKVVATIGMISDVVSQVGGDLVEVKGLMGPGVDPHLFKATPSDVRALEKADVIFYGGLHLESKMAELFEKMSAVRTVVAVTKEIPEKALLSPPGFQGLHDPHVWFDVTLWQSATQVIANTLEQKLPKSKDLIQANAKAYLAKLQVLDEYIKAQAARIPKDQRLIVTAHDAFNYFGQRYDFEVVGLQGISTEAEAGTSDVQGLVDLIVKRRLKAIFIESSVPLKNIQAVQEGVKARNWSVAIGGELFSDAMGNPGTLEGTYIGMLTHNIDTIVAALRGDANE